MKSNLSAPASLQRKLRPLRLVVLDVDGVMTDGRITYDSEGREYKSFDVHDGLGIVRAIEAGLIIAIVSGRSSNVVAHRAKELRITELHQGIRGKLPVVQRLQKKYGVPDEALCAIGDDLPELPVFEIAGFSAAPSNAVHEVRSRVDYVTRAAGGHGAVRELLDMILRAKKLSR